MDSQPPFLQQGPQTFGRWLVRSDNPRGWIVGLCALLSLWSLQWPAASFAKFFEPAVVLYQIVMILALMAWCPAVGWTAAQGVPRKQVKLVAESFRRLWLVTWLVLLALYCMVWLVRHCGWSDFYWTTAALNWLNNSTSVLILLCYLLLQFPDAKNLRDLPWRSWLIIFIVLAVAEIAIYAIGQLHPDAWLRSHFHKFNYAEFQQIAIGCLAGVICALFVSRLASVYMAFPTGIIALLFLYAVSQPLYPYLVRNERVGQDAIAVVYMVLKGVLFLVVACALETGRLVEYLRQKLILRGSYESELRS